MGDWFEHSRSWNKNEKVIGLEHEREWEEASPLTVKTRIGRTSKKPQRYGNPVNEIKLVSNSSSNIK